MSKRTLVICAILAVCLAGLIPFWAFRSDADQNAGERAVPASLEAGRDLFDTNCGACHALSAAGTDGNFGPDLDELLAPTGEPADPSSLKSAEERVLNAIDNGVDSSTPGRMPGGILAGEQARQVAEFVASEAGKG